MAQHQVRFSLPKADVTNRDLIFRVIRDGEVFGRLLVSKGAVVWRRKGQSKRGKKLGWASFDKMMQEGRPERRRPRRKRRVRRR